MNDYKLTKEKMREIFDELRISYESIDNLFNDDDINYGITFKVHGKLKAINTIKGILYLHHYDFSMNFLVLNIYTLDDDDSNLDTLDIYEVTNEVNSILSNGSFLIKDNKYIYYRSTINCDKDYENLNKELLKKQIDTFVDGLEKLFNIIRFKG